MEDAGLKGKQIGGVRFSELHSNWIIKVNEKARAGDVRELISLAQQTVMEKFEVWLQPEIELW